MTREELKRLYESLGPRLVLYLERRTGDGALAADLVQDVFLRLFESPIRLDSESEAKSYLYRMANSRLVDHARRGERDKRWRVWLRLESPTVEAAEADDMGRVFRTLKPRDAALLWLAYVEQMNHNEIAKVLGVKPTSVKVLLHRARIELKGTMTRLGLAPEMAV
jgi:RNA polymerase sigma-70 factor (ECF subfamily)